MAAAASVLAEQLVPKCAGGSCRSRTNSLDSTIVRRKTETAPPEEMMPGAPNKCVKSSEVSTSPAEDSPEEKTPAPTPLSEQPMPSTSEKHKKSEKPKGDKADEAAAVHQKCLEKCEVDCQELACIGLNAGEQQNLCIEGKCDGATCIPAQCER